MIKVLKDFSNRKAGQVISLPRYCENILVRTGKAEFVECEQVEPIKQEDKPKRGRKAK